MKIILLMPFIYGSCSFFAGSHSDKQVLQDKALTIVCALYSNNKQYLARETSDYVLDSMVQTMSLNEKYKRFKIHSSVENIIFEDSNKARVIISTLDFPDCERILYEMTFKRINTKWEIVFFGVDK